MEKHEGLIYKMTNFKPEEIDKELAEIFLVKIEETYAQIDPEKNPGSKYKMEADFALWVINACNLIICTKSLIQIKTNVFKHSYTKPLLGHQIFNLEELKSKQEIELPQIENEIHLNAQQIVIVSIYIYNLYIIYKFEIRLQPKYRKRMRKLFHLIKN